MIAVIHEIEPFKHQPGRVLNSFPNIGKTPLEKMNVSLLHSWMTRNKGKLFADQNCTEDGEDVEDEDSELSSSDEESDD